MREGLLIIAECALKHGVSEADIAQAWEHFFAKQHRGAPNEGEVVLVGFDEIGREIEVIAAEKSFGILVYHANRPISETVAKELGLISSRKLRRQ